MQIIVKQFVMSFQSFRKDTVIDQREILSTTIINGIQIQHLPIFILFLPIF